MVNNNIVIDQIILDKINTFVKRNLSKIYINSESSDEFADEIKSNLIDSIRDLIGKGYSQEDALSVTLKRFGKPKDIKHELRQFFQFHSFKARWLLKTSIVTALLAIMIIFGMGIWNKISISTGPQKIFNIVQNLNMGSGISEEKKQEIRANVDKNFLVDKVEIYANKQVVLLYPSSGYKDRIFPSLLSLVTHTYDNEKEYGIPNSNEIYRINVTAKSFKIHLPVIILIAAIIMFFICVILNISYVIRQPIWIFLCILACSLIIYLFSLSTGDSIRNIMYISKALLIVGILGFVYTFFRKKISL